jgi:hypothetical protein
VEEKIVYTPRLCIVEEKIVYTPPDFLSIPNRTAVQDLADAFNDHGYNIKDIVTFESKFRERKYG